MGFLSTLGNIAGIASGAVSAVGGLFGMRQQSKNDAWQKQAYENSISARVADAERNGLDKYAALSGSSNIPSFTGSGLSLADTSEGFSQFSRVAENMSNSKTSEKIQSLEIRNMELQNRSIELENARLEKELKSVASSPYSGVSPFADTLPQGAIIGSMEVGRSNPVSTSDKLASSLEDYQFDRSLDKAMKNISLVPTFSGGVQIVPAKDLMDWMSEDIQNKLGFKLNLMDRADYIAARLAKQFKAPYFWVDYDVFGNPEFKFSRKESDYLKFLNGDTASVGTKFGRAKNWLYNEFVYPWQSKAPPKTQGAYVAPPKRWY